MPCFVVPAQAGTQFHLFPYLKHAPSECGIHAVFHSPPDQHEFGHLFGGNHNPENNSNLTMLNSWAKAHWANAPNPDDSARTLLSCQIGTCHGTCPQVLNYSNATIMLTKPWTFHTGISNQRENARNIEQFAPVTAQCDDLRNPDLVFVHGFE